MRTLIDIENWDRKAHYSFFSRFEEPFFGFTVRIRCARAYEAAKQHNRSFFLHYLYRALKCANEIENFRYRIVNNEVYLYDRVDASPTISRPNGTFGFAYIDYHSNEKIFAEKASGEIERVRQSSDLLPAVSGENVIHFSAIPWVDFSSVSHARSFSFPDSSAKISFGKVSESQGEKTFSVSIHVHHGLMDAYHVGLFLDRFQDLMDGKL